MYLKDKHALITGISKGIGRSLTLKLLDAGVYVTGWGIHPPDYRHPKLRFIGCDISQPEQVEHSWNKTLGEFSSVDFLINNAGFGYFSSIEEFDVDKWNRMMAVNLTGAFLVTRMVAGLMKQQKTGHIVNISSIAGKSGAPMGEGYNASKYGLTGFSECLFHEMRPYGVKVTTVFPGSTQTHFFDEIEGMNVNENMIHPDDLAATLMHILDSPSNYLIREIEIRPMKKGGG